MGPMGPHGAPWSPHGAPWGSHGAPHGLPWEPPWVLLWGPSWCPIVPLIALALKTPMTRTCFWQLRHFCDADVQIVQIGERQSVEEIQK